MKSSPFENVLASLIRHRGVMGSLVISEGDGIIVDSTLQIGVKGKAVAALTASLYRKARQAAHAAGFGEAGFLQLDAAHGRVCALGRNDLVLVAVADTGANVGLIRVEMIRALPLLQ